MLKKKPAASFTLPTVQPTPETLVPTEEIIKQAKEVGVDFGPGNPAERIRYFVKLGLIPHATRKTHASTSKIQYTVGHHPFWALSHLKEIDHLKKGGMSYPQIQKKFEMIAKHKELDTQKSSIKLPAETEPIVEKTSFLPNQNHVGILNPSSPSISESDLAMLSKYHTSLKTSQQPPLDVKTQEEEKENR